MFKKDQYGDTTLLPCFLILGSIFLIGIVLSVYLFFKKVGKKAILPFTISIIIVAMTTSWMYYYDENYQSEIKYNLDIYASPSSNYTLNVPILDNSKLHSELKVVGDGEIDIVIINKSVPYPHSNISLEVVGSKDIFISGKIRLKASPDLSLNTGENIGRTSLYWFWCNKTDPLQNITVNLRASVSHRNSGDDWSILDFRNDYELPFLENGWNKIKIEQSGWE